MSLSIKYKSDNPIAYIEGGDYNKKALYLHEDKNKDKDGYFDEIILDNGCFHLHPEVRENQTDRIALVGSPGARKSTFIAKYLEAFHKTFPDAEKSILLTVQHEEDFDKVYKHLKDLIIFVQIDSSILEEKITMHDLAIKSGNRYLPRCVIFDDYVGETRRITDEIERLRNCLAANSRKLNITMLVAQSDLPVKNGIYREFLSNCTHMVCFPNYAPVNLKYTLENYFGIPEKVWKIIKKETTSRWIVVTRTGIPYVLTEIKCTVFDADDELEIIRQREAERKQAMKDRIANLPPRYR